jgi:lipopolysaccharide transport system permease protein
VGDIERKSPLPTPHSPLSTPVPINYQSSVKIPLWRPAAALLSEHRGLVRSMVGATSAAGTKAPSDNVNLVKRVVFPTEALPVNLALSAIAQQLLGTVVLLAVALILEHTIHPTALLLPLLLIPQFLATAGLGWLMASLGVFIRDMAQLVRSYRRILLEGRAPDWRGLGVTMAFALVCFIFGYWWFQRTKKAFADIL